MCALARVYAGTGQGNGAENMLRPSVLWRRFTSSPSPTASIFPLGQHNNNKAASQHEKGNQNVSAT